MSASLNELRAALEREAAENQEILNLRSLHPNRDDLVPNPIFAYRTWELAKPMLAALVAVAESAHRLHQGLTCETDPMDVDERISELGRALSQLKNP